MSGETTVYRAYLLRLWRVGQDAWRASLQDSCSQERQVFASLEQLFTYLEQETGRGSARVPPSPTEGEVESKSSDPAGVNGGVGENIPDEVHIVLPPGAEEDELGGEVLEARATKSALLCTPGDGGIVALMPVCLLA